MSKCLFFGIVLLKVLRVSGTTLAAFFAFLFLRMEINIRLSYNDALNCGVGIRSYSIWSRVYRDGDFFFSNNKLNRKAA